MYISNINETKTHLSQLINRVLAGDEVVIARGNQPLVKMVPFEQDTSPRSAGFWAGKIVFTDTPEAMDAEISEMFASSELFPGDKK